MQTQKKHQGLERSYFQESATSLVKGLFLVRGHSIGVEGKRHDDRATQHHGLRKVKIVSCHAISLVKSR